MSKNTKKLPVWPLLLVIALILGAYLLNPLCRYLYTKDFVRRGDIQLAEMLAHDFETADISSFEKPIFFIGTGTTRTNASCLDLSTGEYDIFSVFAAGDVLDLDTVAASQYIVSYLNELGYSYTAPTADDWQAYQDEISATLPLWKSFPWYSSMAETEHCILVQLSGSEGGY